MTPISYSAVVLYRRYGSFAEVRHSIELSTVETRTHYGDINMLPPKLFNTFVYHHYSTRAQVILDTGGVEPRVPDSCLRPYDRTGKEYALVAMSHLPSKWQSPARGALTPSDRVELELMRRTMPPTTPGAASQPKVSPMVLVRESPTHALNNACVSMEIDTWGADLDIGALDGVRSPCGGPRCPPGVRSSSPRSPRGRDRRKELEMPTRHWTSSENMSTSRAGELAGRTVNNVARAARGGAAKAGEAIPATTWVPGNRFRRDLEKLVYLKAREAQETLEQNELDEKRKNVLQARSGEREEPSPRDRLERLKAAEIAAFRREASERRTRVVEAKVADAAVRSSAVTEARENARENAEWARLEMEVSKSTQARDRLEREVERGEERLREEERRQGDIDAARARVQQRQADRTRQAVSRAESNSFMTNASELVRRVRKHTAVYYKTQDARGMRKWVKGQKASNDETRRRLLKRVQELQTQKR